MSDDSYEASHVAELEAAARHRREADRQMSMNERLAALHELCLQLAPVDGTAKGG